MNVVLFGATGDLAARHLLPSLGLLLERGEPAEGLTVAALGREAMTTDEYTRRVASILVADGRLSQLGRRNLLGTLRYHQIDLGRPDSVAAALPGQACVVYLALPPWVLVPALNALAAAGLPAESTLVFDKPYGEDEKSARDLDHMLSVQFGDAFIFRADHFLYHAMSRDVMAYRFSDARYASIWDAGHIDRVSITWDEASGVGARAAYLDRTGTLRDMHQSHLLQYLALVTMDDPHRAGTSIAGEKEKVLAAVRPSLIEPQLVLGRYTAGRTRDGLHHAYVDGADVDPDRRTETFASVTLQLEHPDWTGVPFTLRSGKALGTRDRAIEVVFRGLRPGMTNAIRFEMDSPGVMIEEVRDQEVLRYRHRIGTGRAGHSLPASASLFRDIFAKDDRLALSSEEIASSWRTIDRIRAVWRATGSPLHEYPAGSSGPMSMPEP